VFCRARAFFQSLYPDPNRHSHVLIGCMISAGMFSKRYSSNGCSRASATVFRGFEAFSALERP
jgi:hypothetical protein